MASALVDNFAGEVPSRLEDLVTLPGVGRKTGNVVRSVAFDLPGLPVDTHVIRLSARLGLSDESDPVRLESALNQVIAPNRRGAFSLRMILHGRRTCKARTPDCRNCPLVDYCPSGSAGRS
jgi:endonuclease-3